MPIPLNAVSPHPRIVLFTDTLGDVNGVCRFLSDMGAQARAAGRSLRILTCTRSAVPQAEYIHNFMPVFSRPLPRYPDLQWVVPPILRMLRLAEALSPAAIHISTPGPVGLVGLLAARMLDVPLIGVYHTDFPVYVHHLFGQGPLTRLTEKYLRLYYRRFARVLARTGAYLDALARLDVRPPRVELLVPGVDLNTFTPEARDPDLWVALGVDARPVKVLYVGRVSIEKNLPMLAAAWQAVREGCRAAGIDVVLVVVGDGPYGQTMRRILEGHGARFLGFRSGRELSALYASSDLFVFPSATDTLGQAVLEAQASGLPVLVSDAGGPKDVVADGLTGRVLPAGDVRAWTAAITGLVRSRDRRSEMGRLAHAWAGRYPIRATFAQFWSAHFAARSTPAHRAIRLHTRIGPNAH